MSDFPLPAEWQENLENQWQQYQEKLRALSIESSLLESEEWQQPLRRVWGCSDFCFQAALRYPEMMERLVESGDLSNTYQQGEMLSALQAFCDGVNDEGALNQRLRRFRRREMVRIAWRDITGLADLKETTADLSD